MTADSNWWRTAVTYQVYLRSFADGDGDGTGDIAGLRRRLAHLVDLGVDALWINPWYPSPMADGGYDVADYRDIEPVFGTLEQAESLVEEVHAAGLRILLDIVPNHTSDQHRWFQAALAAGPGSPERGRYVFRRGRGPDGGEPPTNWRSVFGGPAWQRVVEPDGRPGEWYLHLFAPEQPDLNWQHPDVHAEFLQTLRFWFDRGVDGFRIDVAHALAKDAELRDVTGGDIERRPLGTGHPVWDRDEVHEIYRSWRAVADSYDPPRVFVAEAWVDTPERLAHYVRADELHNAFNFELVNARWSAAALRAAIDSSRQELAKVDAPPTWVLSNHDVVRHVSRYGRDQSAVPADGFRLANVLGVPVDLQVGRRRARAAALLMLALPGAVYLYQGEELGLEEVEDLPEASLQDPVWERSGRTDRGRDGCRVPLPWSGDAPPFGFSPDGTATWLPQPVGWADRTVTAQAGRQDSTLALYRAALRLRRAHDAFGDETLRWLPGPGESLAVQRSSGLICAVNLGPEPLPAPDGAVLLTSGPLTDDGAIPTDTAAWIHV